MNRITVVSDSVERAGRLKARLTDYFVAEFLGLHELATATPGQLTLVDIDLRDPARIRTVKLWLKGRPTDGQVIFGVNRESHLESMQAYAIGATGLAPRPVDGRLLAWKVSRGIRSIASNSLASSRDFCSDIATCVKALQDVFAAAVAGEAPDAHLLQAASDEIVERIEQEGLARWLDVIRRHHSQTYQHCLIVTAVAVSFGQHLGFRHADKQRLASAGLLHDVGKARIPIEILEKPGPLSEDETVLMRTHPEIGFEALRDAPGLHPEMLDMVLHHHEYLDGSGYPHGLRGAEISDLVRTITIADLFGALIERRPYRPPLSGADAYLILQDMGAKLDADLVRVFRPLAQSVA